MSTQERNEKILNEDIYTKMSTGKDSSVRSIKIPARDRHKRPDKQLYVPRALRRTIDESLSNGKDIENESDHKGETDTIKSETFEKDNDELLNVKQKPNGTDTLSGISKKLIDMDVSLVQEPSDFIISEESSTPSIQNACSKKSTVQQLDIESKESKLKDLDVNVVKETVELEKKIRENCIKLKNNLQKEESLNGDLHSAVLQLRDATAKVNSEDSWESKFNDEGDCLDPKLVKELCDITGRVELTVSKGNYSDYKPASKCSSSEYECIVELYGFPVEFKTNDLTSAFSSFQESSYNIKWVDDCHALAIFSSPVIASQALHLSHPFIKVRPLSEGIKESKERARYCTDMFETHKPRPVTSAVLARRLVSGALGLKVQTSKEQRDMERNMLQRAKEKKRLKAKQRQDIWDGNVHKNE